MILRAFWQQVNVNLNNWWRLCGTGVLWLLKVKPKKAGEVKWRGRVEIWTDESTTPRSDTPSCLFGALWHPHYFFSNTMSQNTPPGCV